MSTSKCSKRYPFLIDKYKLFYYPEKKLIEAQWLHRLVCSVYQLHLSVCRPLYCSLLSCSAHGILQARILEWVAMSSFRGSSQCRDWTAFLVSLALAGGFFTTSAPLGSPLIVLEVDIPCQGKFPSLNDQLPTVKWSEMDLDIFQLSQ